jgi:hypothetical protein
VFLEDWLIDYLLIYVPLKNFLLIWRLHHYRWIEEKTFNELSKYLHFCVYLPFEDDLVLYFYNLESPTPKDDLYHVWLELACWFWRVVFNINTYNYGFPYCGPSQTPGDHDLNKTESTLYQKAFMFNMTYSGSVVLEKVFKWPHPIFALLWLSPLWRGPGPLFEQYRIPYTHGWFVPSLIEIGLLILLEKIFFTINMQTWFTLLWPLPAPGDHNTNKFESSLYQKAFM